MLLTKTSKKAKIKQPFSKPFSFILFNSKCFDSLTFARYIKHYHTFFFPLKVSWYLLLSFASFFGSESSVALLFYYRTSIVFAYLKVVHLLLSARDCKLIIISCIQLITSSVCKIFNLLMSENMLKGIN